MYYKDKINVCINGRDVWFKQEPIIINDRVMVSVRELSEKLGCDVFWDGRYQTVSIIDKSAQKTKQRKINAIELKIKRLTQELNLLT